MTALAHREAASEARAGFTLVELLVSLAIFVTVMTSVALAFNTAVRTSKQGFQNQEAYEIARGAMKILERDLSRAFTNRDHGDHSSLYGTPIGFTYVGLISADESAAPNMARVTYVIYHGPRFVNGQENASYSAVYPPYEAKDGSRVPTYSLLRFIEPGADDIDSFPVPWTEELIDDPGNQWNVLVDQIVASLGTTCPDAECDAQLQRAARREVWIRMLAGGDSMVPNAWDTIFLDRDPRDYVVAENIRYLSLESTDANNGFAPYCALTTDAAALATLLDRVDFDDIVYEDGVNTCVRFVSSPALVAPIFYDGPEWRASFSSSDGPRPFFTYWDLGTRLNDDPGTADDGVTADDQVVPLAYQFWNDWRNLVADTLDNDSDGTVDEADEVFGENLGSPLDSRLPVAVTTDFTLFFRSPYVGAPDFNERFTQRIDLPAATRRSIKTTAPQP